MSKLQKLYEEYKSLLDMDEPPKGSVRTLFKKFIVPAMFSLESRINGLCNKAKDQPELPLRNKVTHEIPEGWVLSKEFSDTTKIISKGFLLNMILHDINLKPFGKKIGHWMYVDKQGLIDFFNSPFGRENYRRNAQKVDLYFKRLEQEKLKNEQQRQGEADS